MFKLTMPIGKGTIEINSQDVKGLHKLSEVYGSLPSECDNCKSPDLYLSHKNIKSSQDGNHYDYYGIKCKKCTAELTFGQKKDGSGFFVKHGEKMTVYVPNQQPAPNNYPQNFNPVHPHGPTTPNNGQGFDPNANPFGNGG